MPYLGAHMSIAGGYHKAILAAEQYGMEACQLFTRNSNQWRAKPITEEEAERFHSARRQSRLRAVLAHDSYLINLASPDPTLYRRSLEAMVMEMERAETLGLDGLVMHPGSCGDSGEAAGLARVAAALDEVHARCPGFRVRILLETTAGQGTSLGYRFEHLADILGRVREPGRLGVCFDTCHVFAAGYPLSPKRAYLATMRTFGRIIGLDKLEAFHLNDSKKPLGSRVDRHAHIGDGELGLEPFALLLNDRRFRKRPMLLETPKKDSNGRDMDPINLARLRRLIERTDAGIGRKTPRRRT